jgi:transcriptional regulator with PAS, ATPase and Fis domain
MGKAVELKASEVNAAIRAHNGNRTRAAKELGVSVATLKNNLSDAIKAQYPAKKGRRWD